MSFDACFSFLEIDGVGYFWFFQNTIILVYLASDNFLDIYLSNLNSLLPSESMIQISVTQVRGTNYTSNVVQLELCYIITAGIYNLFFP